MCARGADAVTWRGKRNMEAGLRSAHPQCVCVCERVRVFVCLCSDLSEPKVTVYTHESS